MLAGLLALSAQLAHAVPCNINADRTAPQAHQSRLISTLCIPTQNGIPTEMRLVFDRRRATIQLQLGGKSTLLERIGHALTPDLVGAASQIRFLPRQLQPYGDQDRFLFISSRRSTSGDGRGQCGAGVESYLNVLELKKSRARVIAKFLIGSCTNGIALTSSTHHKDLAAFWTEGGTLGMQFMSLGDQDEEQLAALVSNAFSKLLFIPSRSIE